jgi:hypothetical protein
VVGQQTTRQRSAGERVRARTRRPCRRCSPHSRLVKARLPSVVRLSPQGWGPGSLKPAYGPPGHQLPLKQSTQPTSGLSAAYAPAAHVHLPDSTLSSSERLQRAQLPSALYTAHPGMLLLLLPPTVWLSCRCAAVPGGVRGWARGVC